MDAMFIGDFSALTHPQEDESLNKFDQFLWLIDENMDTMVKEDINSANDRFVCYSSITLGHYIVRATTILNDVLFGIIQL